MNTLYIGYIAKETSLNQGFTSLFGEKKMATNSTSNPFGSLGNVSDSKKQYNLCVFVYVPLDKIFVFQTVQACTLPIHHLLGRVVSSLLHLSVSYCTAGSGC